MNNISKLLFCINSGRAGSHYLQQLLDLSPIVASFGEQAPTMSGKYLHLVNEHPYSFSYNDRLIKVNKINEMIRNLPQNKTIYSETNHMFIKTFFDVVMDNFGDKIEIIILRRNLASTLKSFIALDYLGKNTVSYDWMVRSDSPTSALKTHIAFKKMDHCERCIAYLLDIEARAQRFKKQYPNIRMHEVRVEELNDIQNVLKLFNNLGITDVLPDNNIIGTAVNTKEMRKRHFNNNISLEQCAQKCRKYIKCAQMAGIDVPPVIIT
jgi:hypothetical protein